MWWAPLLGPITGVIDKVLDSILPEKMSETEKAELKIKMRAQLFQEMQADREDMKNAREMAMKEFERDVWIVRLLRGLIRPVTGFTFVGFYVWAKVSIHFGYPTIDLIDRDYIIIGTILGFYFGLRSFLDKKGTQ
jgi:hypothetical protein